jgi:hypothetical protein
LIFLQLSVINAAIRGTLSSTVQVVNSETTLEFELSRWEPNSILLAGSKIEIKFPGSTFDAYFDSIESRLSG